MKIAYFVIDPFEDHLVPIAVRVGVGEGGRWVSLGAELPGPTGAAVRMYADALGRGDNPSDAGPMLVIGEVTP